MGVTQRVQQLQGSMDDASNRLVPAEAARSKWINPTELSPQQVQQQMDQLKVYSIVCQLGPSRTGFTTTRTMCYWFAYLILFNDPTWMFIQELSDKIAPVQLTIEEVNDQAARLADSGVPLSHANLSRLDDLNSRWASQSSSSSASSLSQIMNTLHQI